MNNAKVTVTKEVAEAIESLLEKRVNKFGIIVGLENYDGEPCEHYPEYRTLNKYYSDLDEGSKRHPFSLMQALVNGYTVEKTPEDKVREYYERCVENRRLARSGGRGYAEENHDGQAIGTSITLDILGIKIEGVNA